MNANDIRILFDYSYWARERIMRAALQITPEQYNAPNTSSYGSLRGTLIHNMRAEINWRKRLQGDQPSNTPPAEDEYATPQILEQTWSAEEALMRAYLAGLTDAELNQPFEYKNYKGEQVKLIKWGVLMQLVTHGTQHRAEAAAMLTDFNHSPGDVDLIIFLRERGL